jgi:hypothetical protein
VFDNYGKNNYLVVAELEEYIKEYENLQKVIDNYSNVAGTVVNSSSSTNGHSTSSYSATGSSSGSSASTDDPFEYQYQLNKDRLALDLIDQQEYYDNLEELYKTYYKEGSEEYRKYQTEVHQGRKQLIDEEAELLQKLREDALKDFEEYVNEVNSLAQKEADAKIAAIDAELAAREKLKESEQQELKLQQAMAQLAFTTDSDSRKALEKEIKRLKEDIAETEFKNSAEMKKAEIKAQMEDIKNHSSQLVANMKQSISPDNTNPYVDQINTSNIINANGLSVAQVKQMLEDLYNRIMYNI